MMPNTNMVADISRSLANLHERLALHHDGAALEEVRHIEMAFKSGIMCRKDEYLEFLELAIVAHHLYGDLEDYYRKELQQFLGFPCEFEAANAVIDALIDQYNPNPPVWWLYGRHLINKVRISISMQRVIRRSRRKG